MGVRLEQVGHGRGDMNRDAATLAVTPPTAADATEALCVIAVCTYRRPVMLRDCLESILTQDVPSGWEVVVVVVDNDPEGELPASVRQLIDDSPIAVDYLCESRRGIPFARNAACRRSVELGAQWLMFIDDDERALPGWLTAYADVMGRHEAEVYTGPVRYEMPAEYASWLENRGLSHLPDGSPLRRASTNNVLMSTGLLKPPWSLEFDTRLAFSGGSDSDFFTRCSFHGGRIVCASRALVSEPVIENRLTMHWRMKRQFRSSANRVYTHYKLYGAGRTIRESFIEVLSRVLRGLFRLLTLPLYLPLGRSALMRAWYHGLRHFAKAGGVIFGLFGLQPRPYWETDGY